MELGWLMGGSFAGGAPGGVKWGHGLSRALDFYSVFVSWGHVVGGLAPGSRLFGVLAMWEFELRWMF